MAGEREEEEEGWALRRAKGAAGTGLWFVTERLLLDLPGFGCTPVPLYHAATVEAHYGRGCTLWTWVHTLYHAVTVHAHFGCTPVYLYYAATVCLYHASTYPHITYVGLIGIAGSASVKQT